MKKKHSHRASVVLLMVVIVLIGSAGWYVWQNQQSNTSDKSKELSNSSQNSTNRVSVPISLIETKLPSGWTVERKDSEYIMLGNVSTGCWTAVKFSANTAESNSVDVDHNKQTVDAITFKGYSVEESKGKLTIVASSGEKQVDAQVLRVTGLGNPMFQNYAYIAKSNSYTEIQLSCKEESDILTAQSALKAFVFNIE